MKKRKRSKSFNWIVKTYDIDFDLFELNLHSLYKETKIGFNEDLYRRELTSFKGELTKSKSTAIRLSLKSFTKSFLYALDSYGIELDIEWSDITDYGEYELVARNLNTAGAKVFLAEGIRGSTNDIEEQASSFVDKHSIKDRLFFVAATPAILGMSVMKRNNHITVGAAINHMRKDLLLFEQSVIETAIQQFVRECKKARL